MDITDKGGPVGLGDNHDPNSKTKMAVNFVDSDPEVSLKLSKEH